MYVSTTAAVKSDLHDQIVVLLLYACPQLHLLLFVCPFPLYLFMWVCAAVGTSDYRTTKCSIRGHTFYFSRKKNSIFLFCGVQRFGELVTTATAKAKEQLDLKVLNLLALLVQKYKY